MMIGFKQRSGIDLAKNPIIYGRIKHIDNVLIFWEIKLTKKTCLLRWMEWWEWKNLNQGEMLKLIQIRISLFVLTDIYHM